MVTSKEGNPQKIRTMAHGPYTYELQIDKICKLMCTSF